MPVSVPRLNRIEPSETMPNNDRINMQVRDQGANILNQTNAIVEVGDKVGDIYQQYENDKIETMSNVVEREYTSWSKQELAKLKNYEGDPTDAYVDYEKRSKEKYNEILSSRPDVSDRVKKYVTARLDKTHSNLSIEANYQRGMQQETYDNNVFESTVKLRKDNLPVVAGYINKDDPTSYEMFDRGMSDIKNLVIKRGLKSGTVRELPADAEKFVPYMDEDGNVRKIEITPMAKTRIAKELSEGVKNSIEVMIASGKVEEAKAMQEKYKNYLDATAASKLTKKFQTAGHKDAAYSLLESVRGQSQEAKIAKINSYSDPEVRSEALKILDADTRRIEALKDRQSKKNYEALANNVLNKMNSDQPYYGVADLENDPMFKAAWDNISSPKQKKAILEMVDAPKESNPKSLIKAQEVILGDPDRLATMTPTEFAEYTVGLSKSDKTKFTNQFMSLKNQTEGERRAMYKQAGDMLRDQLLVDGHINRDAYGKIRGEDEIAFIEARQKLIDHMANQTGPMSEKYLKDFVKEYSASVVKGKVFNPPPRGNAPAKNNSTTTGSRNVTMPEGQEKLDLKREYRAKFKKFPTDGELLEWLKTR